MFWPHIKTEAFVTVLQNGRSPEQVNLASLWWSFLVFQRQFCMHFLSVPEVFQKNLHA